MRLVRSPPLPCHSPCVTLHAQRIAQLRVADDAVVVALLQVVGLLRLGHHLGHIMTAGRCWLNGRSRMAKRTCCLGVVTLPKQRLPDFHPPWPARSYEVGSLSQDLFRNSSKPTSWMEHDRLVHGVLPPRDLILSRLYLRDLAPFASEFVGTFLLCFTVALCAGSTPFAPLAIGSSLMVSIFIGGHISGGHHNPAVTLAVWLANKQKAGMFQLGPGLCALGYVVAQLLASVAAGVIAYNLSMDLGSQMGTPRVSHRTSYTSAVFVELIFTFFLALTVLNVATARGTEVCQGRGGASLKTWWAPSRRSDEGAERWSVS
jgi:hypothetical protein